MGNRLKASGPADTLRELVSVLEALSTFLAFYGEQHWSARLHDDLELLRAGNIQGLEALLADIPSSEGNVLASLVITPEHGHNLRLDEVGEVNKRLDNLQAEVQRRALALRNLY